MKESVGLSAAEQLATHRPTVSLRKMLVKEELGAAKTVPAIRIEAVSARKSGQGGWLSRCRKLCEDVRTVLC